MPEDFSDTSLSREDEDKEGRVSLWKDQLGERPRLMGLCPPGKTIEGANHNQPAQTPEPESVAVCPSEKKVCVSRW